MNTSEISSLTASIMKVVGEVLADVKCLDIADIDAELLRLKRTVLSEKLDEFKSNVESATARDIAKAEQDLISRGLGNSTVRQASQHSLRREAASQLDKAVREYNRAIEEIALIERRLAVQNRAPWWKKVLQRCGVLQQA